MLLKYGQFSIKGLGMIRLVYSPGSDRTFGIVVTDRTEKARKVAIYKCV